MTGRGLLAALAVLLGLVPGLASAAPAAEDASSSAGASTSVAAPAEVERLRERAAAFWAARVEGDSKGQWELLEPRGRGRMSPGEYAPARGALKYLAYQVEDATVRGHFANVKVRLLVQPILPPTTGRTRNMGPASTVVTDRWIRIGGAWYRSLEQETPESAGR